MKVSMEWVNVCLDRSVAADDAEQRLSAQGLPIEQRETFGDDVILDVEVTSNRPDCLSLLGIAREVAAGGGPGGPTLIAPECGLPESGAEHVHSLTSVENRELVLCPVYTARVIRGVKVGPSPDWLIKRLESIGLRGVNNVVDVTNFVLFELGQPLHAFDMDRLSGRLIVVRTAGDGEVFVAIDGTKHVLRDSMLVIADADRPVAVAGVMGGLESEVGDQTTDILLESAIFDPVSVRRTSRTLKLASDSSFRFERGVDPEGVDRASRRAARLIVELAGGTLAEGVIRAGEDVPAPREVVMRVDRCRRLLGINLPAGRMVELLEALGLGPVLDQRTERITCRIPTFRLDLEREVDLVEEVARLHGLEDIPIHERIEIVARPLQPLAVARQKLGQVLSAHGYHETVTFSFVSPESGRPFLPEGDEAILIEDERRSAEPMLRPSLLPSLLLCRKTNQDVGNAGVALFEAASAWVGRGERILDRQLLGMLLDAPEPQTALRSLRGTVEELFSRLMGNGGFEFTATKGRFLSEGLEVRTNGASVGRIGLLDHATQELFDLQSPVVLGEFDLNLLLRSFPPQRSITTLARFPSIERDLSVVVDEPIPWEMIEQIVRRTEPALLEELCFIGTYRGKPIPSGRKSISFRMVFRDPQKTLRHEEVDIQVNAVVDLLRENAGAELRV